ncbi:Apolipoprotein D [Seminavis robusta]|uniref:Apolipoprotein D n=1 Tax=Seminavis robusta TaxID=568900 RepID=A0A9N8DF84_9STRA|nr:Apolipoprotein D [Seminavis robusta]|eukprot:Sro115_g056750.1 Apolipoprotein D (207) ;mRNA; r:46837-47457
MGNSASNSLPALQTVSECVTERMMGTWFVIAVKPTMFETKNSNAVERYTWIDDAKKKNGGNDFDIDFTFNVDEPITSKIKALPQKGWVLDNDNKQFAPGTNRLETKTGNWQVSPAWPIKMPYLLVEVDLEHYQYCVVGYPSRAYCWIMARTPQMEEATYNDLVDKLQTKHNYDLVGLRKVPQKWTRVEAEKRNLIKDIPGHMLEKE